MLDEQEIERIEYVLIQSFRERRKVTLELFAPYDQVEVIGIVDTDYAKRNKTNNKY